MSSLVFVAAEGELVERHLPMNPYLFGLIALGTLLVLLAITWSFRNTVAKVPASTDVHPDDVPGLHVNTGHDDHQQLDR